MKVTIDKGGRIFKVGEPFYDLSHRKVIGHFVSVDPETGNAVIEVEDPATISSIRSGLIDRFSIGGELAQVQTGEDS
jgi:hypothetical protein